MTAVLRVDSIGKSFGTRRILTSAFFEALMGSVTALVGRNGSGKSTLMQIAAGWLAADHGFVEFRGVRYSRPRASRLALEGLFYLPVDRSILSPSFTLRQHLDAVERRFVAGTGAGILAELGIAHLDLVLTRELSGGERRRAELAVAFHRRPTCLLLDEPFRGIDPKDAEFVRSTIRRLAAEGCAIVCSGHEVSSVLDVSDQVTWLREGSTQPLGAPDEARKHWHFQQQYLGREV